MGAVGSVGARRVLIVGGGLAGLTATGRLIDEVPAGEVLVVEAGRKVGGRLATRHIGRASLDVGAQFFTVRTPELAARVERWTASGLVTEWCRGFSSVDGYPRYRVTGGMSELARRLRSELAAAGVEIVTGQRAGALVPGPNRWTATYQHHTREPDEAAAVILTPPVPESLELLRAGGARGRLTAEARTALEAIEFRQVIALLAVLDRSPALAPPGALQQPDDPTFTFVADNQAKGISDEPAVTFHTSHALSASLWPATDAEVSNTLLPAARALVAPAEIIAHQLKRWRYAGPAGPHPDRCVVAASSPGPLVLAGDAFAGSKVEGAFLSGLAAATAVLSLLAGGS